MSTIAIIIWALSLKGIEMPVSYDQQLRLAWHESGCNPTANRRGSQFYGLYQMSNTIDFSKLDSTIIVVPDTILNISRLPITSPIYQYMRLCQIVKYIDHRYKCGGDMVMIFAIYGSGYNGYLKNKRLALLRAKWLLKDMYVPPMD